MIALPGLQNPTKNLHTAPSVRQNKSKDKVGNMMSAKGKKIHHTNKSSQPKQRLYVTIHDIDNHSADEKNSCQAKPPMDSSIIILKQPKNRQSPSSIKNVSICANARKTGMTNNTRKTKE